jgi:hypothetical protein
VAAARHDQLKTNVVRLAGIEPTTLGFGSPNFDAYMHWSLDELNVLNLGYSTKSRTYLQTIVTPLAPRDY